MMLINIDITVKLYDFRVIWEGDQRSEVEECLTVNLIVLSDYIYGSFG